MTSYKYVSTVRLERTKSIQRVILIIYITVDRKFNNKPKGFYYTCWLFLYRVSDIFADLLVIHDRSIKS
jgi:hypothetical protein